ncbi:uncharacterized protein [Chelonus insularis]|uniref:uncharacterized protein n=1 Tax=Chelonus insularis TaxID=460826 RepID=UPI00158CFD3F|nr:uncharacterized protein LOC118073188 [Chelonus insularis]
MGCCCVEGCTNSSDKKFRMTLLPRDPQRRQKWIKNIGRKNWIPSKHASICEVHFGKDMWEISKKNGKRVLKKNAIPTIFPESISREYTEEIVHDELVQKPSEELASNQSEELAPNQSEDPAQSQCYRHSEEPVEIESILYSDENDLNSTAEPIILNTESSSCSDQNNINLTTEPIVPETERNLVTLNDEERLKHADRIILKQQKLLNHYRKTNRQLKNQSSTSDVYKKILESLFNDCQILYLRMKLYNQLYNKNTVRRWSDKTIKDAFQLKNSCGTRGYTELLKRGFPYPSLRCLRDRKGKLLSNESST